MVDNFTEEKMKTLLKKIFQEEFKKQAEKVTGLISNNFKLTIKEIHGLKNKINDLGKSLEFTRNNLDENVDSVEKRKEKLDSDIHYYMNIRYTQGMSRMN